MNSVAIMKPISTKTKINFRLQASPSGTVHDNALTAEPVRPGDFTQTLVEWGRASDVQKIFGLKRGYLYTLINAGLIKSVCLRKAGARTGVRLFHIGSIRNFLYSHVEPQKPNNNEGQYDIENTTIGSTAQVDAVVEMQSTNERNNNGI